MPCAVLISVPAISRVPSPEDEQNIALRTPGMPTRDNTRIRHHLSELSSWFGDITAVPTPQTRFGGCRMPTSKPVIFHHWNSRHQRPGPADQNMSLYRYQMCMGRA